MRVEYDKEADAAYFKLDSSQIVESEEISPGIIFDFDERDRVVGIEILNLKHKTPEQVKKIDFPFNEEERAELKKVFSLLRFSF